MVRGAADAHVVQVDGSRVAGWLIAMMQFDLMALRRFMVLHAMCVSG